MDIVTLALAKKYADEKLTNGKVDLTGYAKEDYVDAEIEELNKKIVQETGKLSEEKVDQKELENYALKDEIPTVPVQSVNGKTGAVQLSASEVGALPSSTKIPTKTSDLTNDSGFITNLVNNLANYYLKSETYTQEEINQKLSIIPKFSIKVVSSLPTSDINDTTVYLVKSGEDENNLYTEYIYVDGAWELLGKQSVDLSDYALKSDIPTTLSELTNDAGFITKYVSDLENYYVKNDVYNKDEIDAKGYLTEHQDISGLAPKATTLAGYGITDGVTNEQIEQFSGTVEITSDAPTKEQTVLTINPESETVNLYTAEEVDEKFSQLSEEIGDYLPKNQGASNVGKILVVGTDGNLVLTDMPEGGTTGDVTGVLDDSNNILLTGNLADGTYILKWRNDDGTYSDAGTIEVGAIPEPEPTKTNFADPTSADWVEGRISNSAANGVQIVTDASIPVYVTNYIQVEKGDIITLGNCSTINSALDTKQYWRFAVYTGTSHDTRIYNNAHSSNNGYMNMITDNEYEIVNDSVKYVRFTIETNDKNAVIINIKRNGEWLNTTSEPVTVDIALTTGIRIGSDGTDRTQAGYCATPHIDLTDIPKPCIINLTKARWAFTDTAGTGMVMYYATKSDGSKLVGGYTNESVGGGYFTVKINDTLGTDVTVTVTSDKVATIRFSGHWANNNYSDSDTYFEQANTKATLTYTPTV